MGIYIAFLSNINASVYGGYDLLTAKSILGSIQKVGNGWYRIISINYTSNPNNTWTISFSNTPSLDYNTQNTWAEGTQGISTIGDGINGVFMWGAQSEEGISPTSYIPTVNSSRIRLADQAIIAGRNFTNFFNGSRGTFFADYTTAFSTNTRILNFGTGSTSTIISNEGGYGFWNIFF